MEDNLDGNTSGGNILGGNTLGGNTLGWEYLEWEYFGWRITWVENEEEGVHKESQVSW